MALDPTSLFLSGLVKVGTQWAQHNVEGSGVGRRIELQQGL
jgi:hypothetical protein